MCVFNQSLYGMCEVLQPSPAFSFLCLIIACEMLVCVYVVEFGSACVTKQGEIVCPHPLFT